MLTTHDSSSRTEGTVSSQPKSPEGMSACDSEDEEMGQPLPDIWKCEEQEYPSE